MTTSGFVSSATPVRHFRAPDLPHRAPEVTWVGPVAGHRRSRCKSLKYKGLDPEGRLGHAGESLLGSLERAFHRRETHFVAPK
jgi:hypothetical protein